MKRLIVIILLSLSLSALLHGVTASGKENVDYRAKLEELQKIAKTGVNSPDLYYDMGVCQARLNQEAPALISFLRCVNLDSAHRDARSNIAYLTALSKDSQLYPRQQFIAEMLLNVYDWFSLNRTAVFLLLFLLLTGLCLHWLLHYHQEREKGLAVLLLTLSMMLLITFCILLGTKSYRMNHNHKAVITAGTAQLREEASAVSRIIRDIHQGLIVRVTEKRGDELRIVLPNGNVGWVMNTELEMVLPR